MVSSESVSAVTCIVGCGVGRTSALRELMNRHALVIGINHYPFLRRSDASGRVLEGHDLQGCVNDAEAVAEVLCQRFQFPSTQVLLLRNEQATRTGILAAMNGLLDRVGLDDLVVFYFAGHGSQMPDREGTKFDPPLDDTIVPHDSGRFQHPSRDITDDEMRLWLLDLSRKTRYITLVFDCCHSATMHRAFGAVCSTERGLPADTRSIRDLPPSPIPTERVELLRAKNWLPPEDRYVYLAACLAKETAKEITAIEGTEVVHHGALTYALLQSIDQSPSGATYRDVFERACFEVTQRIADQHPQSEGAQHRALFDTTDCPPLSYVLVKEVSGQRVTLAAGRPLGVVVGSEWALFPPGCSDLTLREGVNQPRVRIANASASSAQGVLMGESTSAIGSLWRAVLAVRPLEIRWPVRMTGEGIPTKREGLGSVVNSRDPIEALMTSISHSPWLRLANENETPLLTVQLLPPRTIVANDTPLPQLGAIPFESWSVIDASGQVRARPARKIQTELVRQNLDKIVRHRFLLELRNPSSRLRSKIEFSILRTGADGVRVPLHQKPTDLPLVAAGSELLLQIRNQSSAAVYVAVLTIDALSGVKQIYPPSGTSAPLGPTGTGLIGAGEGRPLRLERPQNWPPFGSPNPSPPAPLDVLLFASLQPLDLRPLLQESVRSQNRADSQNASTLGQLLTLAATSQNVYRSFVTPASQTDDWTIEHRAILIS